MARHEEPHELPGFAIAGLAGDDDLFDFLAVEIADRPFDERAFFVDERRRARRERRLPHGFPHPQQILEVALDLGFGARSASGAENDPHALGNIELLGDSLQSAAVLGVGDFARNAAAARGIGHQNRIAPGQREVSRQRRPLVAALLLDDLHQQNLPALDDLLNLVLAAQARRAAWNLLQGVAADLLDRLALILDPLLTARRYALLGAALERRDFVIVVLMVVFVVIDVVRARGRAAFVDGGGARGSLEGGRFRRRLG